jgi:VanZ family protein
MKQLSQQVLRVMPLIFWVLFAITTALMLIELAPRHHGWPYWDKVQHAFVFAVLTSTGCLAFPQKKDWVCLSLVCYGALIEWLQGVLTITRTASIYDWLADIAGVLLPILISLALAYLSSRSKTKIQ